MADGRVITVDMPIKMDCVDVEFVDALPETGISNTCIYIKETNEVDGVGNKIYEQWMYNNGWRLIGISGEPYATSTKAGIVKPDNSTITVDNTGTISVVSTYLKQTIADEVSEKVLEVTESQIQELFNEEVAE